MSATPGPKELNFLSRQRKLSRVIRAGVIPYVVVDGTVYFCLGKDTKSGELSDFGGGYSPSRDLVPQKCAVRELKEESLGVFDVPVSKLVESGLCYLTQKGTVLVCFLRLEPDQLFTTRVTFGDLFGNLDQEGQKKAEMSDLLWLDRSRLRLQLAKGGVYRLISGLLEAQLDTLVEYILEKA